MRLLLLLLAACHVPYDVPRVPVDGGAYVSPDEGWALAREGLVKARACLADVPIYCVTDPQLIDAAIQHDLDQHHHGRMPNNERWVQEHINRARAEWNNEMKDEPVAIAALVKANWSEPRVEMVKGRADVYLHVPPGRLTLHNGHWKGLSPRVVDGELRTGALIDQLLKWGEARPNAVVIHLVLDVPKTKKGFQRFDVRWFRGRGEVAIYTPKSRVAYSTGPGINLSDVEEGGLSLRLSDLRQCEVVRPLDPPNCDGEVPVERAKAGKSKGKAKGGRGKGKGGRGKGKGGKSK